MPSIRKSKKLGIYVKPKVKADADIYEETRKIVIKANKRLNALKKEKLAGSWASRKLYKRLKGSKIKAYSKGNIKISKNMTNTQLTAVKRHAKQFLDSKTSTKRGIYEVREETIKSLQKTLNKDIDISALDAEDAYDMLADKDFDYFNREDRIPASEMWALIDDAIEENQSEETFINRLLNIMDFSNDLDAVEKARRIYNKYVL